MKQRKMWTRFVSALLLITLVIASLPCQPVRAEEEKEKRKYLILIETKEGLFTGYDDIYDINEKGKVMIRAYDAAKALGLKYKNNGDNTFTISNVYTGNVSFQRPTTSLTFRNGRSVYKYNDSEETSDIYSKSPVYVTKKTSTQSAAYVIDYYALTYLVNWSIFTDSNAKEYRDQGYQTVIILSNRNKIEKLPDITKVRDKNRNYFFPELNTNASLEGPTITLGGVKVPMVKGFKKPQSCNAGSFGNDGFKKEDPHPYYDSVQWFNEYINDAMEDLGYYMDRESSPIIYMEDYLIISVLGVYNRPTFYFQKEKDYYSLKMYVRFGGKADAVLKNTLKLCIASFTSDIDKVFDAVMNSYEGDESCGINKKTWTTIGNTKIKVALVDGKAVYYFKAAK